MKEVAAFILGVLVNDAGSEEAREIRNELVLITADELRALVRLTQTMRDLGALSEDEAHHLIGLFTERFTFRYPEQDPELQNLETRMRAIEVRHGLHQDSGGFMLSEAPSEWRELSRAWDRRLSHLWSSLLREVGEPEMAANLDLPIHGERWAAGLSSLHLRSSGTKADESAGGSGER